MKECVCVKQLGGMFAVVRRPISQSSNPYKRHQGKIRMGRSAGNDSPNRRTILRMCRNKLMQILRLSRDQCVPADLVKCLPLRTSAVDLKRAWFRYRPHLKKVSQRIKNRRRLFVVVKQTNERPTSQPAKRAIEQHHITSSAGGRTSNFNSA
jgi:hypothetical protein